MKLELSGTLYTREQIYDLICLLDCLERQLRKAHANWENAVVKDESWSGDGDERG